MSESGQQIGSVLDGNLTIEYGNNRIIVNDGTTNRLLMGLFPNGDIGLIVVKEGVEVLDVFN